MKSARPPEVATSQASTRAIGSEAMRRADGPPPSSGTPPHGPRSGDSGGVPRDPHQPGGDGVGVGAEVCLGLMVGDGEEVGEGVGLGVGAGVAGGSVGAGVTGFGACVGAAVAGRGVAVGAVTVTVGGLTLVSVALLRPARTPDEALKLYP